LTIRHTSWRKSFAWTRGADHKWRKANVDGLKEWNVDSSCEEWCEKLWRVFLNILVN